MEGLPSTPKSCQNNFTSCLTSSKQNIGPALPSQPTTSQMNQNSYFSPNLNEKSDSFVSFPDPQNLYDLELSSSEASYDSNVNDLTSSTGVEGSFAIFDDTCPLIQRKRARKGQGNRQNWTRNELKHERERGKQYISIKREKRKGVVGTQIRKERSLQPRCDSAKCARSKIMECNFISDLERAEIFREFWNDLSWNQRKIYVTTLVQQVPIANETKGLPSKRKNTLHYSLKVDGRFFPVCKKMFIATLNIGEWSILHWVKNANQSIDLSKSRIIKKNVKPINIRKLEHVTRFLESVPKMPSHYSRQHTNKVYADINYNTVKELYNTYVQYLKDNSIPEQQVVTYKCFVDVVHKMNIGIYRPKKDQCDLCYAFKQGTTPELEYMAHLAAKESAQKEKDADKFRCLEGQLNMFTVDMLAVQLIPHLEAGSQYFKQKLYCHQFTLYNVRDNRVVCYVWHEGEGGMDANNFTSCLLHFLEKLEDKSKPIVVYSDGCEQNRNVTLANALQHFAIKFKTEVCQKYLVVGHAQMECDSVHGAVEKHKIKKELFVPADFVRIIKEASRDKPYQVCYVDHNFFSNFSVLEYYKSITLGPKTGDPDVLDVKALKYTEAGLTFKLAFGAEWKVTPNKMCQVGNISPPKLYNGPIPINRAKYEDLQSLKPLILKDFHDFFDNLSSE